MDRRKFLQSAAATTFMTSLGKKFAHAANTSIVPTRVLGHTGEKISMVGLGGYHIGMQSDEQESIRIIRTSLDSGITFLDNCWDYNNGQSEIRMGKALRDGYRQKAFLMTKIDGRTRSAGRFVLFLIVTSSVSSRIGTGADRKLPWAARHC